MDGNTQSTVSHPHATPETKAEQKLYHSLHDNVATWSRGAGNSAPIHVSPCLMTIDLSRGEDSCYGSEQLTATAFKEKLSTSMAMIENSQQAPTLRLFYLPLYESPGQVVNSVPADNDRRWEIYDSFLAARGLKAVGSLSPYFNFRSNTLDIGFKDHVVGLALPTLLAHRVTLSTWFDVIWTHNMETGATCGLCMVNVLKNWYKVQPTPGALLLKYRLLAAHPMFPGLIAAIESIKVLADRRYRTSAKVVRTAIDYGYIDARQPIHSGIEDHQLGPTSAAIIGTATRINISLVACDSICRFVENVKEDSRSLVSRKSSQDGKVPSDVRKLDEAIQRLAVSIGREAMELRSDAECLERRANLQIQGLFNRIAQRDQNQNFRIANDTHVLARESKKDSASMKAIALLTMVFLPGTYISVSLTARTKLTPCSAELFC